MQYLTTIFALASAISAIDIQGHIESHCGGGNRVTFTNVVANQCYATGGISWAYSFRAIPRNWRLSTRSHEGGNCGEIVHVFDSNGVDLVCHGADVNNLPYTGAGFSLINKKRPIEVASSSQDCIKPYLLEIEDGSTYTLLGLGDETYQTM
ncbi:hypothetical protein G6011_07569 [Alternaria panax]|uniref:Uncharacterized protein n=1 Tax=Alternaria panax TaxID=48097 RepID=A0AAD4I9I5_9PLEO|nr:hypothetical protein G6011_07569 [Alternaria panax]